MRKMKLLTVILFCLGFAGLAVAVDVINIDINGYNDDTPYEGAAAYDDGTNLWRVYYGGYGKPMGSSRTVSLSDYDEPNIASIYESQVWIGDPPGENTYQGGEGLMDDGFRDDPCVAGEPNLYIFSAPDNPANPDDPAPGYGGTFDIYVYGSEAGSFTISSPGYGSVTKSVTGGFTGDFVEGQNYVVFEDVVIDDANMITLSYTNFLNGLQLVKETPPPVEITGTVTEIPAADYFFAGDRNFRTEESTDFGPDTFPADPNYYDGRFVGYLEVGEFMEYDITVPEANEGRYDIVMGVQTPTYNGEIQLCRGIDIYLDDVLLGRVKYEAPSDAVVDTDAVTANLFAGQHRLKWSFPPRLGGNNRTGFNIAYMKATRVGDVEMNDCEDVKLYDWIYAGDIDQDCRVDLEDLSALTDTWLDCDDPDPANCP